MLIPDLTATKDVDPVELKRQADAEFLARVATALREKADGDQGTTDAADMAEKERAELLAVEYEPDETTPVITIGFIPASKLTHFRHRASSIRSMPEGVERSDASVQLDRDVCACGVVDWRLMGSAGPVAIVRTSNTHNGITTKRLDPTSVDIIERMGWLAPLASSIWTFNSLDETTKKK